MVAAPFGLPDALKVAVVEPIAVAALAATDGAAGGVVKDSSAPNEVPTAFEAMAQKKYEVPGDRPESACA